MSTFFLEDVYRDTGYRLAPDARAALRSYSRSGASSMSKVVGKGDRYGVLGHQTSTKPLAVIVCRQWT